MIKNKSGPNEKFYQNKEYECFGRIDLREINLYKKFEESKKEIDLIASQICSRNENKNKPKVYLLNRLRKNNTSIFPYLSTNSSCKSSTQTFLQRRNSIKLIDENIKGSINKQLKPHIKGSNIKINFLSLKNLFGKNNHSKVGSPIIHNSANDTNLLLKNTLILGRNSCDTPLEQPISKRTSFSRCITKLDRFDSKEEKSLLTTLDKTNINMYLTSSSSISNCKPKEKKKKKLIKEYCSVRTPPRLLSVLNTPNNESCKVNFENMKKDHFTIQSNILQLRNEYKYEVPINKQLEEDINTMSDEFDPKKGFVLYTQKKNDIKFLNEDKKIFKLTDVVSKIGENQAFKYKDLLLDKFSINQDNKNPNVINFKIKQRKDFEKVDKSSVIQSIIMRTKTIKCKAITNANQILYKSQLKRKIE